MSKGPQRGARRPVGHMGGILLLVLGVVTCGFLSLLLLRYANAPDVTPAFWRTLVPLAGFAGLALLAYVFFTGFRFQGETLLWVLALFLAGIGLLAQARLGGPRVVHSAAALSGPVGVMVMIVLALALSRGRYRRLGSTWVFCWIASIGVLALLFVVGTRFRGALYLPGYMTPTEIIKPLCAIFLAGFMDRYLAGLPAKEQKQPDPLRMLWRILAPWAVLMALLVLQRDLGMIVLLNMVFIAVWYAATGSAVTLAAGTVGAIVAGAAVFYAMPHGQVRIQAWLDPFSSPTGQGWQVLQGLSAMYSGGLFGAGLGEGLPDAIPVASSDFIYAVIGEELGFLGCAVVLCAYLILVYVAFRAAEGASDRFGRLLGVALASSLGGQALMNVAGVTKALPLTGIPLPFISHGGSSLLVSFASVGILLALSAPGGKRSKRTPRKRTSRAPR